MKRGNELLCSCCSESISQLREALAYSVHSHTHTTHTYTHTNTHTHTHTHTHIVFLSALAQLVRPLGVEVHSSLRHPPFLIT